MLSSGSNDNQLILWPFCANHTVFSVSLGLTIKTIKAFILLFIKKQYFFSKGIDLQFASPFMLNTTKRKKVKQMKKLIAALESMLLFLPLYEEGYSCLTEHDLNYYHPRFNRYGSTSALSE